MSGLDHSKVGSKDNAFAIGFVLVVLVVGAYLPSLHNGFVNLDDPRYVYANSYVQHGLTWPGVRWAFTTFEAGLWHPLTWLSLMLDTRLFGNRPAEYHLTNLILHAANALLLFLGLRRMTEWGSRQAGSSSKNPSIDPCTNPPPQAAWRCAFVSALFALHPLHVESVAWISERKDVLSTFFFLLTLWAYAAYVRRSESALAEKSEGRDRKAERRPNPEIRTKLETKLAEPKFFESASLQPSTFQPWHCYALALLFFALGLMSKPMLVTTPLVLLLLDFWPLGRFSAEDPTLKKEPAKPAPQPFSIFLEKAPFFALALIGSIAALLAQRDAGALQNVTRFPLPARLENALLSYAQYLAHTIWPAHYAVFYPYPKSFHPAALLAAGLLLFVISATALRTRLRRPYLAVGWAWYLVTLLPVIGLVQVGMQALADRYTYIPLIGILILVVWSTADFVFSLVQHQVLRQWCCGALGAVSLLICAPLTWHQIGYWHDSETLYRHAIDVTADNQLAHLNLGATFASQHRLDDAIREYQETVRIAPDYALAQGDLGAALLTKGELDDSMLHSRKALELRPGFAGARRNLGTALGAKGRFDEAIAELREAVRLAPGDFQAHYYLGYAYACKNQLDDAVTQYQEAARLAPGNAVVQNGLQAVLAAKTRKNGSPQHYGR